MSGPGAPLSPSGRVLPPYPHAQPELYHRTLRTWTYAAWRPIVGIALTVGLGIVVGPLVVTALVGVGLAFFAPDQASGYMSDLAELTITPAVLLTVNLSLAMLIPTTFLAIRVLHGMRPRWLSSVRPGLRWGLLAQLIGLALLASVVFSLALGFVAPQAMPTEESDQLSTGTTVAYLVVILLTSPLQSAAEEYAFRGYLLQAFGALVRNRLFTLLLTSLLFALAHGGQDLPLFTDRFLFGLVAGALVIYTGGLEAGIALHIVNNVVVLAIATLTGAVSETLNVSEATWSMLLLDIGQLLVFALLVVWWVRRKKLRTHSEGPPAAAQV
ncbi:MAG TPA: CPBP family intramembrane glutamic endopeptidase [Nocardioidaceae bacterium]|nr:CPBP family intramembrane glutamic endopeptidase [Nocardioidaceae bacterium]